jgi:hypothetical protein
MAIMPAACIAQACYSVFAQQRDLIYELMQGKGWSEPVLNQRSPTVLLTQVLVDTDTREDSDESSSSTEASDISHENEADDSDIVSEESQSSH